MYQNLALTVLYVFDCVICSMTVLYTLTVLYGAQGLLSSDTIAIEHGLGQTLLSEEGTTHE